MLEISGVSRDCFVLRSSQRRTASFLAGARTPRAVDVLLVDVEVSRNVATTQRTVLLGVADFYSSVL